MAAGSSPDAVVMSMPQGGLCARGGATKERHGGGEAPLDLIEGHLTSESEQPQYRRATHGGALLKNWFVPESWDGLAGVGPEHFVLKIQPFAKGGYEASIRLLDLEKIGDAVTREPKRGTREVPEEISQENLQKAAGRAKRKMRHLVRNMMADHLVTFTKTEGPCVKSWGVDDWAAWNDGGKDAWERKYGAFMNEVEWAKAWDRFRRLLVRVLGDFPYVAILEKHRKGNCHLHVAWCGRVKVDIVRKIWLAALGGGRGCGNIDAKHMRTQAGGDRASRIARYISKYVSKHFESEPRFNKKRYWASRQTLEEVRRYVLTADTLDGAMEDMRKMLGLDFGKFVALSRGVLRTDNLFLFPDGSGLWLNYIPEIHGEPPPF